MSYRSASVLFDEWKQTTHDYSHRAGTVVQRSEILAPDNVPDWVYDRERLWNAAIASEKRKDARWMKEDILSLDYGLDRERGWTALRSFVQDAFVSKGIVVDLSQHRYGALVGPGDEDFKEKLAEWKGKRLPFLEKDAALRLDAPHVIVERDRDRLIKGYRLSQPHGHAALLTRAVGPDGLGAKLEIMNQKRQLIAWRKQWEDHLNAALADAGNDRRVDCRSYKAQGLDKRPGRPQRLAKRLKCPNAKMKARLQHNREVSTLNAALQTGLRVGLAFARCNPYVALGEVVGEVVAREAARAIKPAVEAALKGLALR